MRKTKLFNTIQGLCSADGRSSPAPLAPGWPARPGQWSRARPPANTYKETKFFNKRTLIASVVSLVILAFGGCDTGGKNTEYAGLALLLDNETSPTSEIRSAISTSGYFYIRSVHSQKYLEIAGASKSIGANLQQNGSRSGWHRQWTLKQSGGYYVIKNRNSGKLLDVNANSMDKGANIHQWNPTGNDNQKWKLEDVGNNIYVIRSKSSNKVLDVAGFSTANGGNIHQWSQTGANNQKWTFVPVPGSAQNQKFVSVSQGKFMRNGAEYKVLSQSLYPLHAVNYDYITRMVKAAKAYGHNNIRVVIPFQDVTKKVKDGDRAALFVRKEHLGEPIWRRIDWLLKKCADENMTVALEISDFRETLKAAGMDNYTTTSYTHWNELVKFVTNRKNHFNGKRYKSDPTIFSYSIIGEISPLGHSCAHYCAHPFEIEAMAKHLAAKLKAEDSKHLVGVDGFIHMSKYSYGKKVGKEYLRYWEPIWSDKNVNYGGVHFYPQAAFYDDAWPFGEYNNISEYVNFLKSKGKPFVIETGIRYGEASTADSTGYMRNLLEKVEQAGVKGILFWNMGLSGFNFDLFPGKSEEVNLLMNLIKAHAPYFDTSPYGYRKEIVNTKQMLFNFENGTQGFSASDLSLGTSTGIKRGTRSLRLGINSGGPGFKKFRVNMDAAVSTHKYLAVDVFLPAGSKNQGMTLWFNITSDTGRHLSHVAKMNSVILPGQWNTVYVKLQGESIDFGFGEALPTGKIKHLEFWLQKHHSKNWENGELIIDNIRFGNLNWR